jgi:hypothetical protein
VTPALKWKEGAGKSLKRAYGNGSERTSRRKRKNLGELAQAASGCLDIGALFRRQQDLGISQLPLISQHQAAQQRTQERRRLTLEDMEKLLRCKTAQIKKYGHALFPESDFHRRHCMVRNFMYLQKYHENVPGKTRGELAKAVAASFDRRQHTTKKLQWEKAWIDTRILPESKAGKHKARLSWLDDEGILCAIQNFVKSQGEGE